ncbi:putative leucine--tRNA ligase [Rosa chinensis]|uniref:Putative leucine--tRNA ligase n=1 Tax=Rosa chinensis TaxID=74649 RepID=A0A2P6R3S3_ROSCH|nr:putative leucine--tRNA ligase [Rosa chinensis]
MQLLLRVVQDCSWIYSYKQGEKVMAVEGGKKSRRDRLKEIEEKAQKLWEENGVFRAESCEKRPEPGEKFFGNFPLPYMNGFLHVGHAFSLSKLLVFCSFS